LLDGIVIRQLSADIYGVTSAYVCRHYLEIAIKYALFHSRWLKNEKQNAADAEIVAVAKTHNLQSLWDTLMKELKSRMPSICATGLDLKFVGEFVAEFHQIDASGERFRYPTEQIAIGPRTEAIPPSLAIGFDSLLLNLIRAHDVLETLDSYLVEQHGENEDWQNILNSF
jgi:hypothetical protein